MEGNPISEGLKSALALNLAQRARETSRTGANLARAEGGAEASGAVTWETRLVRASLAETDSFFVPFIFFLRFLSLNRRPAGRGYLQFFSFGSRGTN